MSPGQKHPSGAAYLNRSLVRLALPRLTGAAGHGHRTQVWWQPWVVLAFALAVLAPAAEGQGLKANISRTQATTQDQLLLTLTVSESSGSVPVLPELPDFSVIPRRSSSQVSITNGRRSSSISHNYILVPKRTGTFTIGPATVEISGKTYQSNTIRVRILDAAAQPQDSRDVFVTAKVSDDKPYVGQQILYTWRFYRKVQVGDAQLGPQDFSGFLSEDLGEAKQYQTTVNGQQYVVHEIRKALFPQEAGQLTIPASELTCQVMVRSRRRSRSLFDDFFGATNAQTKVLRTKPIGIEVRPLPAAASGFSGLVGQFQVSTKINKNQLRVGESATLSLTVSGRGNVQMIGEPSLGELSGFKIYDDKPTSSTSRTDSGLSGRRLFSKAMVPLEVGELTIPSARLVYFDPEAGSYRTAASSAITLQVSPAEGEEDLRLTESVAPTTGKVAVKILADDILPLHKGLDAVARPPFGATTPTLTVGLAVPMVAFLGLFAAQRQRRKFALDSGLKRRKRALKTAQKNLGEMDAGTASAPQASLILRTYIGDKLNIEGSALTPQEAQNHLTAKGVNEELATQTRQLLEGFEASQYGAGDVETGTLRERIESLVKQLEGHL
ncbi:MAG: BatD family protein [Deltaproteobacteria bacterium]|nr:BatD family protein [Deltaproteobacteria bacterium]